MIPGKKPPTAVIIVSKGGREPNIEKALEVRGITVQWARSVRKASVLMQSTPAGTVVVTELSLRDGDWRDLMRRLRAIGKSIPVVLLNSTRTAELWWEALDYGVEEIIQAPLSTSELYKYLTKQSEPKGD